VSSSAGGGAAARRQKLPSLQDDVKEFLRGATLTPKDANAEQSLNTPSPASVPDSLDGVRQLVRHGEWERVRQLAARCISHPGAVPVPAADVICMRAHMVTALLHLGRHKDVANVFADEAVQRMMELEPVGDSPCMRGGGGESKDEGAAAAAASGSGDGGGDVEGEGGLADAVWTLRLLHAQAPHKAGDTTASVNRLYRIHHHCLESSGRTSSNSGGTTEQGDSDGDSNKGEGARRRRFALRQVHERVVMSLVALLLQMGEHETVKQLCLDWARFWLTQEAGGLRGKASGSCAATSLDAGAHLARVLLQMGDLAGANQLLKAMDACSKASGGGGGDRGQGQTAVHHTRGLLLAASRRHKDAAGEFEWVIQHMGGTIAAPVAGTGGGAAAGAEGGLGQKDSDHLVSVIEDGIGW
jgi:hypothetical protein